ncbi:MULTISPECIES: glycosyltransferase family 2 protein [Acetobacteraceae]|uniref:glycosyltransferase family 2 protein n=1 Tax=Acetobacteraceae TaxID=433 RepID=UPI0020124715|nr:MULTISPECIES: glycosyltransferase family 2 protein [Acetobacteraceae]MCL1515584.1 hypothetical protein [Parasaccharibacter sp. TMW2.1890]
MKTALVGIVKNEAHDILYWLAWHALLGVDSFILFDDDSDDGTRDLVTAASLHWDVRLFHIREHSLDLSSQDHAERQRQVYLDALSAIAMDEQSYDWVGFLDTDEYVRLYAHETLPEFLESLPADAGAVALHWQVYGHDNHITTPSLPPFHSFSRHSTAGEAINRHVKSFIRPHCWKKGKWVNVHYFALAEGRYVTSSGAPVAWSAVPGITVGYPDWAVASLMHFQRRSLEQFVKRVLNRKDLQLTLSDHQLAQWNDIEDTVPREKTSDVLRWVRPVITAGAMTVLEEMRRQHPPIPGLTPPSTRQNPAGFRVFSLHPKDARHPGLVNDLLQDLGSAEQQGGEFQLFLIQSLIHPEAAFLFGLDEKDRIRDFFILHDGRLTGLPRYDILPVIEQTAIALRQHGGQKRFLCSPPTEPMAPDRQAVSLWECFITIPQETTPSGASWLSLSPFNLLEMALGAPTFTLDTISTLTAIDRETTVWLLPLLALHLQAPQYRELHSHLGALAPFIL